MLCPASARRSAGRSQLELSDIFREHADRLPALSSPQARAVSDIMVCRTAALGGHLQECDTCGHQLVLYNSCRNRHCPKCQHLDQARWIEAQQDCLLPTEYHHVVFTVPDVLHALFLTNQKPAYDLLFSAAADTLKDVAARPQNLGAKIGFSGVLHTWNQKLLYHPHLHCIVTGGGLDADGSRWVAAKPSFLFPVRILARVFRGKLLEKLQNAVQHGQIRSSRGDPHPLLERAARKDWVVYSKPPFGGPEQVLRYLGRYTQRIAISNSRLVSMHDDQVTFRWKDRAHGHQTKLLTVDAAEFLRRFLLHVLPKRFVRIRHYGLLANSVRAKLLARCRELLEVDSIDGDPTPTTENPQSWQALLQRLTGKDVTLCPQCGKGHLVLIEHLPALRLVGSLPARPRPP